MFSFRSPTSEDVGSILAVLTACDIDELGHPDSDAEDVTWRWRQRTFEVDKDAIVAEAGGRVVAYALVQEGHAEAFIEPGHRGRGLGTILETALRARARDRGDSPDGKLRQNATNRNTAGRALLEAAGYKESHHYARMEIELDNPPPVTPPPNVTLRTFDPSSDEKLLYDAYNATWRQYAPSWRQQDFEDWRNEYILGPDFDPGLIHLALEEDEIVAFTLCYDYPGMGWLQLLGTRPHARGRGFGEMMLRNVFHVYKERGLNKVALTVSSRNLPQARRLYERAGMREVIRYVNYSVEL